MGPRVFPALAPFPQKSALNDKNPLTPARAAIRQITLRELQPSCYGDSDFDITQDSVQSLKPHDTVAYRTRARI